MDRPASIRWQCAALSDTRLSSSDSTPSQFGRKFDFRKGRGLALVQAPTFLCLNNECSRAACRLAALRRRVLINEVDRVFTPPHQTPTRTAQTHACDTASDQSESAQANAQAFGETARWLRRVVQDWLNYRAIPGNSHRMGVSWTRLLVSRGNMGSCLDLQLDGESILKLF